MTDTTCWLRQATRVAVGAAAALAAVATAGGWCRRVTVQGASMVPALRPGDRVVVVVGWWLSPGEIVAAADPRCPGRLLIKRVTAIDRSRGTVSLLGDNAAASTDSRTFGPVPRTAVFGRVVYRYAPTARAGWIGPGRGARSSGRAVR